MLYVYSTVNETLYNCTVHVTVHVLYMLDLYCVHVEHVAIHVQVHVHAWRYIHVK